MNGHLQALLGVWETEDEESRANIEFTSENGKLRIRVFDKVDGEEFDVSGVRRRGNSLHFDVTVPSSGYRTGHVVTLVSPRRLFLELTIFEHWKKVSAAKAERIKERASRVGAKWKSLAAKARKGDGFAARQLFLHHQSTEWNPQEARRWAKIGARNGDKTCQNFLKEEASAAVPRALRH